MNIIRSEIWLVFLKLIRFGEPKISCNKIHKIFQWRCKLRVWKTHTTLGKKCGKKSYLLKHYMFVTTCHYHYYMGQKGMAEFRNNPNVCWNLDNLHINLSESSFPFRLFGNDKLISHWVIVEIFILVYLNIN